MKTGFKNVMEPKKDPKYKPKDGKNSPWNFDAPEYDQRSSCFVNAGYRFGVGHKQPVGTKKHINFDAIPKGRVDTLKTYEEAYEND